MSREEILHRYTPSYCLSLLSGVQADGHQVVLRAHTLDGRRYMACAKAGREASFVQFQGKDPLGWVISQNLHRRHLTESQRGMIAAKIANMRQGQRKDRVDQPNGVSISQADAAKILSVSQRGVQRGAKVINEGIPELIQAVEAGIVRVSPAAVVATLPKEEQVEVVAKGQPASSLVAIRSSRWPMGAWGGLASDALHIHKRGP